MLGLYVISFSISMSLLFFSLLVFNKIKIKILGEKMRFFFFFFFLIAFQILYMFLSDISIYGALIEYAYI
jgi:hypothetical protein